MKMGTDLNASMANIGSLGVDTSRLKEMKDDILNISIETGKTALDVADGMYQVVSAFGDGADSLKILRINAKAATAGLSTLPEAIALTSAVTKGWNDTSAEAVLHVADLALKTVELGQTTFPELATSLQQVTLLTAGLGITQEEMFAAMAAGVGTMGSASEVAVKLRGAEQALMKPNADMIAAFKSIGVTSGQALIAQKGLGGAMLALKGYADKSGNSLTNMFGSVEGLAFAMYMSGAGADAYAEKLEKLGGATGKLDSAFLAQMGGINASGAAWEQAQRKVEAFLIKLQDGIAPAVSAMISALTPMLDQLIDAVRSIRQDGPGLQAWVIGGFALLAALGPLLMILPGIISAVQALSGVLAVLSGPIGLAILAVVALGAAWQTNFGGIQEKTAAAVEAMRPYFDQLLEWMGVLNGGSMPAPKLPKLPAATLAPTGNAVAGLQGISGMLDQIDTSATNASDSVAILVGWLSALSAMPLKAMTIDVGLAQKRGDFVVNVVMDFATATAQIAAWAALQAQNAWQVSVGVGMNFANATNEMVAWIALQAQNAWAVSVGVGMNLANATNEIATWVALQAQNAWAVSVGVGMNFANATNQLVTWVALQAMALWQVSVGVGMNFANATNQLVAWMALQAQSAVTLYAAWEPASLATLRLNVLQLFQSAIDLMASWGPDVLERPVECARIGNTAGGGYVCRMGRWPTRGALE